MPSLTDIIFICGIAFVLWGLLVYLKEMSKLVVITITLVLFATGTSSTIWHYHLKRTSLGLTNPKYLASLQIASELENPLSIMEIHKKSIEIMRLLAEDGKAYAIPDHLKTLAEYTGRTPKDAMEERLIQDWVVQNRLNIGGTIKHRVNRNKIADLFWYSSINLVGILLIYIIFLKKKKKEDIRKNQSCCRGISD